MHFPHLLNIDDLLIDDTILSKLRSHNNGNDGQENHDVVSKFIHTIILHIVTASMFAVFAKRVCCSTCCTYSKPGASGSGVIGMEDME